MMETTAKIDFVCIGAQKCATTWLHDVLATHPDVGLPQAEKEVDFFSYHFDHGFQWYENRFDLGREVLIRGEVSPSYHYGLDCPARVHAYNPQMRLILIARDPVARARSNHKHEVRIEHLTGDDLSFARGLANNPLYVEQGLYAKHLKRWLEYFPSEQMLVLKFEHLLADPAAAADAVCRHLGIPTEYDRKALSQRSNVSYLSRHPLLDSAKNGVRQSLQKLGLRGLWDAFGNLGLRQLYRGYNRVEPESQIGKPDPAVLAELRSRFREDSIELGELCGFSVDDWLDES